MQDDILNAIAEHLKKHPKKGKEVCLPLEWSADVLQNLYEKLPKGAAPRVAFGLRAHFGKRALLLDYKGKKPHLVFGEGGILGAVTPQ